MARRVQRLAPDHVSAQHEELLTDDVDGFPWMPMDMGTPLPDESILLESSSEELHAYFSDIDINSSSSSNDNTDEETSNIDADSTRSLYYKSPLTVLEASRELVRLARALNVNKSGVNLLLKSIRALLPAHNRLPRTFTGLLRSAQIKSSNTVSYYCTECMQLLKSSQDTQCGRHCSLNGRSHSSIHVAEFISFDVEKQIKSVAERHMSIIKEYSARSSVLSADIPNGTIFNKLSRHLSNKNNLTVCLHTDGAPLVKVGSKSIWPIQATLVEVAPPLRDRNSAVMVLGVWLATVHPNREIFWKHIVQQLQLLQQDGIRIRTNKDKIELFGVRIQSVLFDLPALALHLNVKQFNGYDSCPYCKTHGTLVGNKEVFYPYGDQTLEPKTHDDYLEFGRGNYPRTTCFGILGPTPLSNILLLPLQVPKDYMHMVAGGHMRWLISMWQHIFLPGFLDSGTKYLEQVIFPHSFKYQFLPFVCHSTWKTKMFRDFLLYVAPVFCVLFIPDKFASHFLSYFVYVRTLHFFNDTRELDALQPFFDDYYKQIEDLYGPRSPLCSLHMHVHLVEQVRLHGCLSMTSCFARESFLSYVLRQCHGTRHLLQQFALWYDVDQSIRPINHLSMDDVFFTEKIFDEQFVNHKLIAEHNPVFHVKAMEHRLSIQSSVARQLFARFTRGLSVFHSQAYTRGGLAISYRVSLRNDACRFDSRNCYAEIIFYTVIDSKQFAFVKLFKCTSKSLAGGLQCSRELRARVDQFYRFCEQENFVFDLVPVSHIFCKVVRLPLLEDSLFCFTPVYFDFEHD